MIAECEQNGGGEGQEDSIVTTRWRGCLRESTTEEVVCVHLRLEECCSLFTQADPDAAELDTVLCVEVCVPDYVPMCVRGSESLR